MTHDLMCPAGGVEPGDCHCDLIDKVRADTVEQIWLASKARQAAAKVRADTLEKRHRSIDATLTLFSQDIHSLDNCVGDHEARLRTIEQILGGQP